MHTVAATRQTADDITVTLWTDGMLTDAIGARLRGVPARRPTSPEGTPLKLPSIGEAVSDMILKYRVGFTAEGVS